MDRKTRSNKTFSSWAVVPCPNNEFDFIASFHHAMFNHSGQVEHEEFEPETHADVPAPAPSPPSESLSTSAQKLAKTPLPRSSAALTRKEKTKAASRARERKKRFDPTRGARPISGTIQNRYPENAPLVKLPSTALEDSPVACTGFVALDDVEKEDQVYTLQEATGIRSKLGYRLQRWNGRDPTLIVDRNGIICVILAGHPNDPDWESVHKQAAQALEMRRDRCTLTPEQLSHRRGVFATLTCGVSYGGGQTRPMNLKVKPSNKAVLEELNKMECFKRIANFGSAVTMRCAPQLYNYYAKNLEEIHGKNAGLKRPFPGSVYSSAAYNFGPQTVCYEHKDFNNVTSGWCPVTPFGDFDPTKGGHLILAECRLVIEFPPGSTILLPSAVIAHSNCAIGPGKKRYSFTQFTTGGLFRWVNNGHQTLVNFQKSLTQEELAEEERKNKVCWEEGLSLLPKVSVGG